MQSFKNTSGAINTKYGENKKGFTLIEILIVIGIISILAAIVIIAINPARQFAQARNAQRWSNVNTILNAVHQYSVDNNGTLPPGLITSTSSAAICTTGTTMSTCTASGLISLASTTDNQRYLVSIPIDPSCPAIGCTGSSTGYRISTSTNGRVTVDAAPNQELGVVISVTR